MHYMKHPFKVTAGLSMTENGLRVVDDGREYPYPPQEHEAADSDVLVMPLVWKHHTTGRRALMVNSRCMLCVELGDGTMLPVVESRLLVEKLMRRGAPISIAEPFLSRKCACSMV